MFIKNVSIIWFLMFLSVAAYGGPKNNDDGFSMVLTGDSLITGKLSTYKEPEFLGVMKIIQEADVSFSNFEMLLHDYESWAMHEYGGANLRAAPAVANEMVWAGFDMLGLANNHTYDYGVTGMRLTKKYIEAAGIVAAGSGESLGQAREPAYFDTPKGRVALISCSSSFLAEARAAGASGEIPAHPGLNPLRYGTTYTLIPEEYRVMKKLMDYESLGDKSFLSYKHEAKIMGVENFAKSFDNDVWFLGKRFVKGENTAVHTKPYERDMKEIAAMIKIARRSADWVIVSIHAHEAEGSDKSTPAEFVKTFSRAMIDAGADVIAGHGPHILRGIEIYKGRPIFYSLGNFVLPSVPWQKTENDAELFGADSVDDVDVMKKGAQIFFGGSKKMSKIIENVSPKNSVVASLTWDGPKLSAITLQPIMLDPKSGRPMLVDELQSQNVINSLQVLSEPFGAEIVWDSQKHVGRISIKKE